MLSGTKWQSTISDVFGYDFKATKQFIKATSGLPSPNSNTSVENECTENKLDEQCLTGINYLLDSHKLKSIMDSLRGESQSVTDNPLDYELDFDIQSSEKDAVENLPDSGTTPNDEVKLPELVTIY